MSVALHLQHRIAPVAAELEAAINAPGEELAPAVLAIGRVEYPSLDAAAYLRTLDRLGREAASRLGAVRDGGSDHAVAALNEYLYDELGFSGNRDRYDDPRNSFLNEVLDRRTGLPISLAIVYLEVARRVGLRVSGVNFPGHFLLRAPSAVRVSADSDRLDDAIIIDPFHGGAKLSEVDCRALLHQHVGGEAAFDRALLEPATRVQIVVRVLVNLKRLYVRMRSFPQARFISDLLLGVDPSAIGELRDRGLLAYHLQDFAAALRDLEAYLTHLTRVPRGAGPAAAGPEAEGSPEADNEDPEHEQIWEHVKTLRRRVAGFN